MKGLTINHRGRVFSINSKGRPQARSGSFVALPSVNNILIMINGFDFDPTEKGRDNPHLKLFPYWEENLRSCMEENWAYFGFGWYSAELELSSWIGGALRAHWNPYRWAWELAGNAGGILAQTIQRRLVDEASNGDESISATICIIAHSLGVRVALSALTQLPAVSVNRILLLNGSEYSQTSKVIANYTNAEVLNCTVNSDDVLNKLGSVFAPEAFIKAVVGQSGIELSPSNWVDFCLDDQDVQTRAANSGYDNIRGDNPTKIADHWYSYNHDGNWPLFCDFLSGKRKIDDLRNIANPTTETSELSPK